MRSLAGDVPAETVQLSVAEGTIDLSWGHPDPALIPVTAWRDAYASAVDDFDWTMLTYGYKAGPRPMREWLAGHLADVDGRAPDPAELVVTAGVSAGLQLVAEVLTEPAQVALVESPTYYLAARILRDAGLDVVAVESDDDGIDPHHIAAITRRLRQAGREVGLLYLMPTFANPTGRSLPPERRDAILGVCAAEGIPIVEDDTYRDLWYGDAPPPSLWSQSTETTVVRLGSFSKTVGPGLRLGCLVAGAEVVERVVTTGVVASGGCLNHATAVAMGVFGASGAFKRHTAELRDELRSRRDALVDSLASTVPDLRLESPAGGYFVWARCPVPVDDLTSAARRAGVAVLPGQKCFTDGRPTDAVRLSFSMYSAADLRTAAGRLGTAVDECRR